MIRVRIPVGARHARMMDALEQIHHELVEIRPVGLQPVNAMIAHGVALHVGGETMVIVTWNIHSAHMKNKTRTGMKYSWETRDWNPVRRVRSPAIPLAGVVKLGITRDSYSRIAVRIRRPLRIPSTMRWGQNKFFAM